MNNTDRKQFAQLCTLLSQAFDKEISTLLADIYFDALKDFDIEQVASAVHQAIKSRKFMPKVAELRELIEGGADDRAEAAWRTVCDLVKFEGEYPSLHVTDGGIAFAIECWGGWVATCAKLGAASPEMIASYAKEFKNSYRLGRMRDIGTKYFVGAYEVNNSGLGQWKTMTVDQPVMLVETHSAKKLILELSLAAGRLTDESLTVLATGAGLGKFLPPKALPPATDKVNRFSNAVINNSENEMATPEQVAELKASISALVPQGGRK